jgi:hypothetical protein
MSVIPATLRTERQQGHAFETSMGKVSKTLSPKQNKDKKCWGYSSSVGVYLTSTRPRVQSSVLEKKRKKEKLGGKSL